MILARCTYCSAPKRSTPGLLPAVERYLSTRIDDLHRRCQDDGQLLLILSGRYGLLRAVDPIPWYDQLLLPDDVPEMVARLTTQLAALAVGRIEYHTAPLSIAPAVAPYLRALQTACKQAGVTLEVCELDGDIP